MKGTMAVLTACAVLALALPAMAEEWRYNVNHRTNGEWWGGDNTASNPTTDAEGWATTGSGTAGWARGVVGDHSVGYWTGKGIYVTWNNWASGTYNYHTPNTIPPGGTPFGSVTNLDAGEGEIAVYSWVLHPQSSSRIWYYVYDNVSAQIININGSNGLWSVTTSLGSATDSTYYDGSTSRTMEFVVNIPHDGSNATGAMYIDGNATDITAIAVTSEATARDLRSIKWLHKGGGSAYSMEWSVQGLLLGDANKSNLVDTQDFTILKAYYGQAATWNTGEWDWGKANFNFDAVIDSQDFSLLKGHFGDHAPEPVSIALVALGGLGVLLRRRRR